MTFRCWSILGPAGAVSMGDGADLAQAAGKLEPELSPE